MRKNAKKEVKQQSEEFFDAFNEFESENNMNPEALIETIKAGILQAVKKDYPYSENVRVDIDPAAGKFDVAIIKEVVDGEPEDPDNQISLDAARAISDNAYAGGTCEIKINTAKLGRIAAQNAKQNIKNRIKDYEKEKLVKQYEGKVCEIVSAVVQKVEPVTGNAVVTIDKKEVYFLKSEQIPGEEYKAGDIIQVYVVGISNPDRRPSIKISRTHRDFVKRLFEKEIPEIADGTVEIKAISRVAGVRSKVAVSSNDENVDAVGACIGSKKSRISAIVGELNDEKIDVIPYSDNPQEFIARALAPAEVVKVVIPDENLRECKAVVPDSQLSLAIGNRGQNAKLAAGLTKFKIDILAESTADEIIAKEEEERAKLKEQQQALEEENLINEDFEDEQDLFTE
ncbi:MAG: transcription termination factor NusA [Oscillospiraceae bacterium]